MRETYKPASEQTVRILSTDRELIATEMDLTRNTLDQIIAGNECDPFLKFKRMYAGAVRAGVDVTPWDVAFQEIKTRHANGQTIHQSLSEKVMCDADTAAKIIEALKDGQIDRHEVRRIREAIQRERNTLDVLEAHLNVTEPVERDNAKRAHATVKTAQRFGNENGKRK
jgi:hypothetical protein